MKDYNAEMPAIRALIDSGPTGDGLPPFGEKTIAPAENGLTSFGEKKNTPEIKAIIAKKNFSTFFMK